MTQFARPLSDVTVNPGWTTDTGGTTNLFAAIDETTASNTDYLIEDQSVNDTYEVLLSSIADPQVGTGHVVRYRYAKSASSGNSRNLTIGLYQGATLIASTVVTPSLTTFLESSLTLTATQANAITDYSDLRLRFTGGGSITGSAANRRSIWLSYAVLETPDAPVATTFTRTLSASAAISNSFTRALSAATAVQTSQQRAIGAAVAVSTPTRAQVYWAALTVPAAAAATLTRSLAASAAISDVGTRSVGALAAVSESATRLLATSAAISATQSRAVPTSAAIQETASRMLSVVGAISTTETRTVGAQAAVQTSGTRSLNAALAVQTENTRIVSASIAIQAATTRSLGVAIAVQNTNTRSLGTAMAVSGGLTRSLGSKAAISETLSRTIGTAVAIQETATRAIGSAVAISTPTYARVYWAALTVPASLVTNTRSLGASVSVQETATRTLGASAALSVTQTQALGAQAAIRTTETRTLNASASLVTNPTRTLSAAVAVTANETRAISAEAAISTSATRAVSASAAISISSTRSVSASVSVSGGGTKLYFGRDDAIVTFTPATWKGAWDSVTSAVTSRLSSQRNGVGANNALSETTATVNWDRALVRQVSDPIAITQTIGGTLSGVLLTRESPDAGADMVLHLHVWVTVGDSDTVRGTLLADYIDPTEWAVDSALFGAISLSDVALSSVNAEAGDRIVVEAGYRAKNSVGTAYTGAMVYGGDLTDAAAGETGVAYLDGHAPHLLFSETIRFASTTLYLSNSLSPATPSSVRGTWDDSTSAVIKALTPAPRGTSLSTSRSETSATSTDALLARFVSEALSAQTISGDVAVLPRITENSDTADAFLKLHMYVMAPDGSVRGVLLSNQVSGVELTPLTPAVAEFTVASVTAQTGDRLVVELGAHFTNTVTTSKSSTMFYGGPTAELASGSPASDNDQSGWVRFMGGLEFAGDLGTFQRAVAASAAISITSARTLGATAAISVTSTHEVPAQAAITTTSTRSIAATAAISAGSQRAVATSAAIQTTSQRAVTASVSVSGALTRSLGTTVAVEVTEARSLTASVSVSITLLSSQRFGGLMRTQPAEPLALSRVSGGGDLAATRTSAADPLAATRSHGNDDVLAASRQASTEPIALTRQASTEPLALSRTSTADPLSATRSEVDL